MGMPPMPMRAGAQPASMSTLAGGPPQGAPQQPPSDAQEKARSVMRQVRELSMAVQGIARQFPAAAPASRQVADGLKQMMVSIVSDLNKTQESPPAPPVTG